MEEFLAEIRIRDGIQARLWDLALTAAAAVPEPRLFKSDDTSKAELRTWLAWQKEPGASYGLATSMGAFDLTHRWAAAFRNWLDRLIAQL